MADNRIVPQDALRAGIVPTYAVAGAGAGQLNVTDTYYVQNNGRVLLHFKKSGATDCIVTVDTPGTVDDLAVSQRTVTIPATTGDKFIGPFPPSLYNQAGANAQDIKFTLDNITGLTCAVIRLP